MSSRCASVKKIFLARTEEQEHFRRVLRSHLPSRLQVHFPTVVKVYRRVSRRQRSVEEESSPYILLFHGEGGMGKTTLSKRLHELVEEEFEGWFVRLWLDWEEERYRTQALQVGHDFIRPETLLNVLYRRLGELGFQDCFEEYCKAIATLKEAERKVEEALRQPLDSKLPDRVKKWGAQGVAYLIRSNPIAATVPQKMVSSALETTFEVGAEGLHQTRLFVEQALSSRESYEIYSQPHDRLAAALGRGVAKAAQPKAIAIFFDTYEIVDRPACDYAIRHVIKAARARVVWVISGRANLASSERRGKENFYGYQREFSEERLYARSLSEFGTKEIAEYFQQAVPERSLSEAGVSAIADFSLGIPFVVSQAAAMWREKVALEEIVAPVERKLGEETARDRVIKATSERFLVHCFAEGREDAEPNQDLQAVYALAMLRRPDVGTLQAMLDVEDLEAALQNLRQRYSFVLVERIRLDEKLAGFLREYLFVPIRRQGSLVQALVGNAIAHLELQIEARSRGLESAADRLQDEFLAELMLDLTYYKFWQDEDEGWKSFVPRFVEGWQYDTDWVQGLLEVAETFQPILSKTGRRRLQIFLGDRSQFYFDPEERKETLDEIEKLAKRQWLSGEGEQEREAIVLLQWGRLYERQKNYDKALQLYEKVEEHLPEANATLRNVLANQFCTLGDAVGLNERNIFIRSQPAKIAFSEAVRLNPENASAHYGLGAMYSMFGEYRQAETHLKQAIALDPNHAYPHNGLGNVYNNQGKYEEAIAAFQQAIALDPNHAYPHNGLGNVYNNQGKYEEAIAAFQQAIALDSKYAYPHNGLGNVYAKQGKYEEAIAAFQHAIALDSKDAYPHDSLGAVYREQGKYEEAIAAFQKAIALDPEYSSPHLELGYIALLSDRLSDAEREIEAGARLATTESIQTLTALGLLRAVQGRFEESREALKKALALAIPGNLEDDITRPILRLALGETELALSQMQQILQKASHAPGLLKEILPRAKILTKSPEPPAGIETTIEMIEEAISASSEERRSHSITPCHYALARGLREKPQLNR